MKVKQILFVLLILVLLLTGCGEKEPPKEKYLIRFIDWDDTVLLETTLEEGEDIVPPENPTREGYTFIGWDKEFSKASQNLDIKAVYERNKYLIRFYDGSGNLIKQEEILHGEQITPPNDPVKEGYVFVGWDKQFDTAISNLDINAQFERLSYKVRFFDDKGNLLKEQQVFHGEKATPPMVNDRDIEEFSHWDKSYENVKEDLDIIAVFKEKEYSIEFYDGNTKLFLDITKYKPSEEITLPILTKEGYAFAGWFLSDISLFEVTKIDSSFRGNIKLYSRWISTTSEQLTVPEGGIEFTQIVKKPHSSGTGFVYQPEFPAGAPSTSVLQYDWASSNTKVATISSYSSISIVSAGYAVIIGTYKANPSVIYYCVIKTSADGVFKTTLEEANAPNYVTVTFKLSDTETIEKVVQKGGFVIPPTPKEKAGYVFTGWVGEKGEDIYNIIQDTTFIPTYQAGSKSYAGKTVSILGDSISTYLGYIPSGFAYFYPYPTADFGDVNQTWWMQFINHYGMKLLVNNSWSGSAVAGTATSAAHKMSRLEYLNIGQIKPDVIVIFMGANDAASPYITLNQFDEAYGTMLNNIKQLCPNSEIILCKLPPLKMYEENNQSSYNQVIDKYAKMYNLTVFNFDQAFNRNENSNYLVDSAHPNKEGMNLLAQKAITDFWNVVK